MHLCVVQTSTVQKDPPSLCTHYFWNHNHSALSQSIRALQLCPGMVFPLVSGMCTARLGNPARSMRAQPPALTSYISSMVSLGSDQTTLQVEVHHGPGCVAVWVGGSSLSFVQNKQIRALESCGENPWACSPSTSLTTSALCQHRLSKHHYSFRSCEGHPLMRKKPTGSGGGLGPCASFQRVRQALLLLFCLWLSVGGWQRKDVNIFSIRSSCDCTWCFPGTIVPRVDQNL